MSGLDLPCLNIAIAPLQASSPGHWATWVVQAPYPGGYVHHDCLWPEPLTQAWQAWRAMFSSQLASRGLPSALERLDLSLSETEGSYSSRLMQYTGIQLWQWLFHGSINTAYSQSRGIAMGQGNPLRLRLELRDPQLVLLPWEIMQPQEGKQAVSLSQQILFSRTTSDVDPLMPPRLSQTLKVLLVLGQAGSAGTPALQLEEEAQILARQLQHSGQVQPGGTGFSAACQVDTLIQPTPAELVAQLESGGYSIFFYAGHGIPAPDGGQVLLCPGETLSGTELAQVLTRCQVAVAIFNACWGAQPYQLMDDATGVMMAMSRSSLAEVLIHYGVPAVLGMRDSIADDESLCFIETFSQALSDRVPVDQAVAIARQQLLTLYKFNQPGWTLPVLYMHPEFNGVVMQPVEGRTELPTTSPTTQWHESRWPLAQLRLVSDPLKLWSLNGGLMRVGRRPGNDIVVQEPWVSQLHAEIICRVNLGGEVPSYFLRDFSRYGTLIASGSGWQRVHHQEVELNAGTQLRFGSTQGETLEFIIQAFPDGDTHY
ncbi:MAG: CHAT domain-containing protein [Synechococcales cyanobacterium CRU_2_2]|nr:CHAT domain-containing protein [Synechococcales cyanobacterium CRU_2_2]